jgi:hypothetical protein
MVGVILVGVGTLVAGVAFQRFLVRRLAKQHREVKESFGNYFDTDVFSSEHSIATFIESNYPAFPMSGKDLLWALSEDYKPCAVAYDTEQMLVCKAELQNGKIRRRENQAEIIDFAVPCVNTIWLLRQTEEKPVIEVDILYSKNGMTKELKLIRFAVDVDGGMNYHKFRHFTNVLKSACKQHNLGIRDLIR